MEPIKNEIRSSHSLAIGKFGDIIDSCVFKDIVKACNANPLFSHRYTDVLIKLLAAHSVEDPELLILAEIATEMGIVMSSLIYPSIDVANCVISDATEEGYAVIPRSH